MTVAYLQTLRKKLNISCTQQKSNIDLVKSPADSTCDQIKFITLIPAKLENGNLTYVLPHSSNQTDDTRNNDKDVWRPW